MSTIAHVFFGTHLGQNHVGLGALLAKKTKSPLPADGETAIFINKAFTGVKMLTATGALLYVRREKEGINPETIKYLPSCVEGPALNYKKALESAVKDQMARLRRR